MQIATLTRVFDYNGVRLPDPAPHLNPEQVRDIYAATYPDITSAQIEGPENKAGKLVYSFRRAVGTKGSNAPTPVEIVVEEREGLHYVVPADPRTARRRSNWRNRLHAFGNWMDRLLGLQPAS